MDYLKVVIYLDIIQRICRPKYNFEIIANRTMSIVFLNDLS